MTINEVIARVKLLRNPTMDEAAMLHVINQTEAEIYRKIIAPRAETIEFTGYTMADADTKLQAPFPFDDLYMIAIFREIDAAENQITNYNNSERHYNEVFGEFAAWWMRTHRHSPEKLHSRWWFG
jgi:hypothetical protein